MAGVQRPQWHRRVQANVPYHSKQKITKTSMASFSTSISIGLSSFANDFIASRIGRKPLNMQDTTTKQTQINDLLRLLIRL